jgi:hypothetical protein
MSKMWNDTGCTAIDGVNAAASAKNCTSDGRAAIAAAESNGTARVREYFEADAKA